MNCVRGSASWAVSWTPVSSSAALSAGSPWASWGFARSGPTSRRREAGCRGRADAVAAVAGFGEEEFDIGCELVHGCLLRSRWWSRTSDGRGRLHGNLLKHVPVLDDPAALESVDVRDGGVGSRRDRKRLHAPSPGRRPPGCAAPRTGRRAIRRTSASAFSTAALRPVRNGRVVLPVVVGHKEVEGFRTRFWV